MRPLAAILDFAGVAGGEQVPSLRLLQDNYTYQPTYLPTELGPTQFKFFNTFVVRFFNVTTYNTLQLSLKYFIYLLSSGV